jgi:hypothetical protein
LLPEENWQDEPAKGERVKLRQVLFERFDNDLLFRTLNRFSLVIR